MKLQRVFVDSDVVYSAILSRKGAAHLLLHTKGINRYISNYSVQELQIVLDRNTVPHEKLDTLIADCLAVVNISLSITEVKKEYQSFVNDIDDAHIVAGCVNTNTQF